MQNNQTRITLVSLVRQITDLERPIEAPTFTSAVVHPDYVIIYWKEIPRKHWGSFPYKIPQITNTKIEYKKMVDSNWTEVSTYSDTTTAICLYKKNPIHRFSQNHQVWDYFWNEYDSLEKDIFYDVRICYENNHKTKNWTTISSIGIPSFPPSFQFCGFLKDNITSPIPNQCYLVLKNETQNWKEFENCLAMYSTNRGVQGWVIYYPRKGWIIDNFVYDGKNWVDNQLKKSMKNLYKTMSSKDILFKVLKMGFSSRFFHDNMLEEYYIKYIQ